MIKSSVRPTGDVEKVLRIHGNLLFRTSLIFLGNAQDAEDVVQETMISYMQKAPVFESEEHEKAWLLTVLTNKCRDLQRLRMRHPVTGIEELKEFIGGEEEGVKDSGVLDALMTLPEKFRMVLVLYYVEGYRTEEIAKIIGKSTSAVKMRLQKGRKLLEDVYRREYM